MNSRSLRRTRLIGLAMLALVAAAAWYFILGPRFSEPDATQETAAAILDQKSLIDQQALALQRRQRYLPVAENEVLNLDTQFPAPDQANAAGLGLAIAEAAAAAGIPESALSISIADPTPVTPTDGTTPATDPNVAPAPAPDPNASAGPAPAPAPGGAAAVPSIDVAALALSVNCTPQQLNDFLRNLSQMRQALAIDEVSVSYAAPTSPDAGASAGYATTIKARAFYLSPMPKIPDNLRVGVITGASETPAPTESAATSEPATAP